MSREHLRQFLVRFDEVAFIVARKVVADIKEQVSNDLTTDQHLTMRYIEKKGRTTSSELAEAFYVNRSAITAIINRLYDKGYIERVPDQHDRRVIQLQLTNSGQAVVAKGEEKIQKVLGTYLSQLEEREITAFLRTFEKLAQIVKEQNK